MEDSFNLGAYMKNYRQERHISLRAAFPEAASTLSRFENGKTRMGGRKLRVVMQREGLRYWDFQQNSLEYLSPFKQLIDNLYIKRFNLRVETVTADIQLFRTRTAGSNSRLVNVVNAVLDMLFCDGDVGNSRLAKETQLSIQELLFRARDWIIFDYGLLWLSAPYLDTIMLKRLFRRAMIQYRDAPSGYVDYFVRVLDRISVILLCRHDEDVAALAAPFVNVNKIDASIGDDAVSFRFLQIMFANGTRTEKERQIGHLQEKLQVIGLSAMQAYFRRLADLILEVPTVGGGTMTLTVNELILHLRHDRQVTLDEVRGNWSVATLSRFERGEIELADSVISQMAIPLGLDYEDLVIRHFLSTESLDDWRYLASEMWDRKKVEALLANIESLQVAGMRNVFLTVAVQVIRELLAIHTVGRQSMRPEIVVKLSKYLENLSDFSRLEGVLFSVCLEYVPIDLGWEWVRRQIDMLQRGDASPQKIRRFISFCANAAERAAIERQFSTMATIVAEMRRLDATIPENAIQRNNIRMMETLLADLELPSPSNHRRFIEVLQANALLFTPSIHESMIEYTIMQGWASAPDFE